jgi:hypothetical protein
VALQLADRHAGCGNGVDGGPSIHDRADASHLERKPGSSYRQLFVKGRRIAASALLAQLLQQAGRDD